MHSSLENKIVAGGQAFLSAGPPNGASNGGGKTDDKALALWLACINGHTGDIPSLIKDFNDIEHRYPSFEGNTVFHAAALYGQTEVLKLLLNLKHLDPAAAEHFRGGGGARSRRGPHLQNDRGQTPLHLAASAGKTEAVRLLIVQGAGVGARDARGETPLHAAARAGRAAAAAALVEAGAHPRQRNNNNESPEQVIGQAIGSTTAQTYLMSQSMKTTYRILVSEGYSGPLNIVYHKGAVVREGEELDSKIIGSLPGESVCHSFGSVMNAHGVLRYLICSSSGKVTGGSSPTGASGGAAGGGGGGGAAGPLLVGWVSGAIRGQPIAAPGPPRGCQEGRECAGCKIC